MGLYLKDLDLEETYYTIHNNPQLLIVFENANVQRMN